MIMLGKHSLLQGAIRHIHRRSPRRVYCTSTQATSARLSVVRLLWYLVPLLCNQAFRHVDYLFLTTCSATMFAVYLLSDPNGPPTAFLQFRPQCAVGVFAGTDWGVLRCPGRMASGTNCQPLSAALLHCCCTGDTCYQTHPFGQAHVSWVLEHIPTVFVTVTPFITS